MEGHLGDLHLFVLSHLSEFLARLSGGGGSKSDGFRGRALLTCIICTLHTDYHNGTTLPSPEDLQSGLLGPYDVGAQGVVMWGSSTELNNSTFLTVQMTAQFSLFLVIM